MKEPSIDKNSLVGVIPDLETKKSVDVVGKTKNLEGINPNTGEYFAEENHQRKLLDKKAIKEAEYSIYLEMYRNNSVEELKQEYKDINSSLEDIKQNLMDNHKKFDIRYNKLPKDEIMSGKKERDLLLENQEKLKIKKQAAYDAVSNKGQNMHFDMEK